MKNDERGSGASYGEAMSNGRPLPVGWLLREAHELVRSSFWQMT